jgi:hypothetical protein
VRGRLLFVARPLHNPSGEFAIALEILRTCRVVVIIEVMVAAAPGDGEGKGVGVGDCKTDGDGDGLGVGLGDVEFTATGDCSHWRIANVSACVSELKHWKRIQEICRVVVHGSKRVYDLSVSSMGWGVIPRAHSIHSVELDRRMPQTAYTVMGRFRRTTSDSGLGFSYSTTFVSLMAAIFGVAAVCWPRRTWIRVVGSAFFRLKPQLERNTAHRNTGTTACRDVSGMCHGDTAYHNCRSHTIPSLGLRNEGTD